jgi:transposase
MMEVLDAAHQEDLDVPGATFAVPDVTTFARLEGLGLQVVGQFLEPDRGVLACRVVDPDHVCRRCGDRGIARDTVTRRLAHEPLGWRPTLFAGHGPPVPLPGLRPGVAAGHVGSCRAGARLSPGGLRWALEGLVCQHLTIARIAEALGVSWNTANDAVLAEGKRVLIDDPHRLDGVQVIGVDEREWRHTRRGDKFVTVIIDLTPIRDKTGPARLLDMIEGRSKKAFASRPEQQDSLWRNSLQVVAMDRFTGFKTATTEQLPDAVAVMDPFHVVRLAGDALDECRRRVHNSIHRHRGRKNDPLYRARRTLHTGADLLTDRQRERLKTLLRGRRSCRGRSDPGELPAPDRRLPQPRPNPRETALTAVIGSLTDGVPTMLVELRRLGRTLAKRAADVLAYFDRPGTSNGPTEAINGRLEHLRGSALGFRNLTHYIARSLLETGGFRPQLHRGL